MDIKPGLIRTFSHHTFQSRTSQIDTENTANNSPVEKESKNQTSTVDVKDNTSSTNVENRLSEEQIKEVEKLKKRDQEVRNHEAAHLAAAGQYASGGPSFSYERGPDGKSYAVGGEVNIDTSKVADDPHATLRKAQQIQAAANAPADPSSQDRKVAAQAAKMAAEAQGEIQQQQMEKLKSLSQNNDHSRTKESDEAKEVNNAAGTYEAVAGFDPEKKINMFNFKA